MDKIGNHPNIKDWMEKRPQKYISESRWRMIYKRELPGYILTKTIMTTALEAQIFLLN